MKNNDELQVQIQYALVEKLSASNRRQAKVLSLLDECIFECNKNFIISYANNSWFNKLGYLNEIIIGKCLTDLMSNRDALTFKTYSDAVLYGEGSPSIELQLYDSEGVSHWFEMRLAHDDYEGLIGSLYDIQRFKDFHVLLTQQQEYTKRLSLVASHTSNLVIITDRYGLIEWVNQSFEKLTGYSCEEVIGKSPGKLLQGEQSDSKTKETMAIAIEKGTAFNVETINYTKSGNIYWVAIDATPVCDESGEVKNFIAIQTNITNRIKTEAAMAEIEYNYHTVVDNIPDIVLRMDSEGHLLFINQAWGKLLKCQESESIGSLITHYVASDDINKIKIALYDYRQGKRDLRRFDIRLIDKQKAFRWVEITLTPIEGSYGNALTSIAATLIDIHERVEAEQVLLEAKHYAETLAESKSRFMANISHEIRTPLNAVIGSADILHDSGLTAEQMRYTQMIKTSGDALLSILDDVLTYSRFEAQSLTLNNEPFRLDTCLEEAVDIVCDGAVKKGLELILDFNHDVPIFAVGDHSRIRQIVINLLANAIKFTDAGLLKVKARCINLMDDSYTLVLSVKDTGIGIVTEKLQAMFEPFIQSDNSITREYGGSGLGLAICKQICDAVNGKIYVKSEIGIGSEFLVEYPLKIDLHRSNDNSCLPQENKQPTVSIIGNNEALNDAVENVLKRYKIAFYSLPNANLMTEESSLPDAIIVTEPELIHQTQTLIERSSKLPLPCILLIDLLGKNSLCKKISDNEVIFNGAFKPSHLPRAIQILEEHLFQFGFELSAFKESFINTKIAAVDDIKPFKGGQVLVAEDNVNNQLVIRTYLEKQGCNVHVVANGQLAFEMIKEENIELVFMDIQMPVLDGISATKLIRSHSGQCSQTPIIALTANAIHGDKERFIEAGMNDYLAKPIDPQKLQIMLAKYLTSSNESHLSKLSRLKSVWQFFN